MGIILEPLDYLHHNTILEFSWKWSQLKIYGQGGFLFCYALLALGCCGRFKMVYSTKAKTPIDKVH